MYKRHRSTIAPRRSLAMEVGALGLLCCVALSGAVILDVATDAAASPAYPVKSQFLVRSFWCNNTRIKLDFPTEDDFGIRAMLMFTDDNDQFLICFYSTRPFPIPGAARFFVGTLTIPDSSTSIPIHKQIAFQSRRPPGILSVIPRDTADSKLFDKAVTALKSRSAFEDVDGGMGLRLDCSSILLK